MGNQQNKLLLRAPKIWHRPNTVWLFFLLLFFFSETVTPTSSGSNTVGVYYVCHSILRLHVDSCSPRQYGKSQESRAKNMYFFTGILCPLGISKYFSLNKFISIFHITMFPPPYNNIAPTTDRKAVVKLRVNNNKLMIETGTDRTKLPATKGYVQFVIPMNGRWKSLSLLLPQTFYS